MKAALTSKKGLRRIKKLERTRFAGDTIAFLNSDEALSTEALIFGSVADGVPDYSITEVWGLLVAGTCKNQVLITA